MARPATTAPDRPPPGASERLYLHLDGDGPCGVMPGEHELGAHPPGRQREYGFTDVDGRQVGPFELDA